MDTQATITHIASLLGVTESSVWNIYYNSAIDYLNRVESLMKSEYYNGAFFGLMRRIGVITNVDSDTFRTIETSSYFWLWWTFNFSETFRLYQPANTTILELHLDTTTNIIPTDTLTKILANDTRKGTIQSIAKRYQGAKCNA